MTQREEIIRYIKVNGSISSMEAFKLGVTRLSAVIYEMKKAGYKVITENILTKTKFGTVLYARYSLEDEKKC